MATKRKAPAKKAAAKQPDVRYRTVIGWDYKTTRSEPGQLVPKSTPQKVIAELLRQNAIEEEK